MEIPGGSRSLSYDSQLSFKLLKGKEQDWRILN